MQRNPQPATAAATTVSVVGWSRLKGSPATVPSNCRITATITSAWAVQTAYSPSRTERSASAARGRPDCRRHDFIG